MSFSSTDDQKLSPHLSRQDVFPTFTAAVAVTRGVTGICVCTEIARKKEGGREETKWQEAMFSIRERRLASGRSHRRGAGFAECALGILIRGHSSSSSSRNPPHPGRRFCMHDRKNPVQTQHGAPQTKHNNVTFSTSSVDDPKRTLSLSPLSSSCC